MVSIAFTNTDLAGDYPMVSVLSLVDKNPYLPKGVAHENLPEVYCDADPRP